METNLKQQVMSSKYTYKFRPGYKSKNYLIEFVSREKNKDFQLKLEAALSEINVKFEASDSMIAIGQDFNLETKLGSCELNIDDWDFAFIHSENNQELLFEIDKLLEKSAYFEKLDVNLDKYK